MSQEIKRNRSGSWLLGLLGGIAAILGIRYASSNGWWYNSLNPNPQTYQTVSTGANVLVSSATTSTGLDVLPSPKPSTALPPDNSKPQEEPRKMW